MENQEKLFKMFCGDDELRTKMLLPFEFNGKIYATDAHKLIRCDKSILEFKLTNKEKPLNAEAVIPKENCNRILKTKVEDFEQFKIVDDYDKVGKDLDCKECTGTGSVEWSYKNYEEEHDCPVCDGSGYSSESRLVPNGKKTFDKKAYLTIDGIFFNINLFMAIFEAQKIIGDEIISLNICTKTKPALFKIGNYEFVIMPIMNYEGDVSLIDLEF